MRHINSNSLQHVAIIMDGNRRWAKKVGFRAFLGHRKGVEKLEEVCQWCIQHEVSFLTVYAFSTENWKREESEVRFLLDLFREVFRTRIQKLHQMGIKVRIIGLREKFPEDLQKLMSETEHLTEHNSTLTLQLALSYGGRSDIFQAVQGIVQDVHEGKISPQQVNENMIGRRLWTSAIPDPDLIIRTGGEKRLSNFLPWESIYSELYFTDKFWPEFSEDDFSAALTEYSSRQRRYGK